MLFPSSLGTNVKNAFYHLDNQLSFYYICKVRKSKSLLPIKVGDGLFFCHRNLGYCLRKLHSDNDRIRDFLDKLF